MNDNRFPSHENRVSVENLRAGDFLDSLVIIDAKPHDDGYWQSVRISCRNTLGTVIHFELDPGQAMVIAPAELSASAVPSAQQRWARVVIQTSESDGQTIHTDPLPFRIDDDTERLGRLEEVAANRLAALHWFVEREAPRSALADPGPGKHAVIRLHNETVLTSEPYSTSREAIAACCGILASVVARIEHVTPNEDFTVWRAAGIIAGPFRRDDVSSE